MASSNFTTLLQTDDSSPYHILYFIKKVVEVKMTIDLKWCMSSINVSVTACLVNTQNLIVIILPYRCQIMGAQIDSRSI